MAIINTKLAAGQKDASASGRPDGDLLTGNVVFSECEYETAAGHAPADVIDLCLLPAGATVLPGLSVINAEALGTGFSVKIGDDDPAGADDDRYSGAVSLATLGRKSPASGVADSVPYTLSAAATIKATIVDGGSFAVTAGKKATFWIAWRMP